MKYLVSVLLFLLPASVQAQVVAVQNLKENVAYVGVATPLIIAVENCPAELVVVTVSNGKIKKDSTGKGRYILLVDAQGTADVSVGQKTRKGIKPLYTTTFRCKRIPDDPVVFANKVRGPLSKADINRTNAPQAIPASGVDMESRFKVICFTVIVTRHSQEVFRRTISNNDGAYIDSVTKKVFKHLKNNDSLLFEDITIKFLDYKTGARSLKFTVTKSEEYDKLPDQWEDPVTGEIIKK